MVKASTREGTAWPRGGKHGDGRGGRLSGGRRIVPDRSQRKGRREITFVAGIRFVDPGVLPAVPDWTARPDNEALIGTLAFRPEASLLYLNAEHVMTRVRACLDTVEVNGIKNEYCDSSAPQ